MSRRLQRFQVHVEELLQKHLLQIFHLPNVQAAPRQTLVRYSIILSVIAQVMEYSYSRVVVKVGYSSI